MADAHPLVGAWKLVSCEHELDGGKIWAPFGPKPFGRLVYTADGFMIVVLGDPRRKKAGGGLFEATDEDHARSARGFIAYSGRWRTRGGKVYHTVDVSLFPNWVGSTQERAFKVEGDEASFSTKAFFVRGVRQTARLVWRRERPR